MATRTRRVIWTEQGKRMLDDAVSHLVNDSHPAAERLLIEALACAATLNVFSERGRIVPEWNQPSVRELFVQQFRLLYEVTATEVHILAFIHGARDLTRLRLEG